VVNSNPNTSEDAKAHAAEVLDQGTASAGTTSSTGGDEHENRVLGGHKATLSNPNASAEAKEHSKEVLAGAGSGEPTSEHSEHEKRVLAGYKGVLASE
jgi:hypothetical protein